MRQKTREERRLERALRAARWIIGILAAGVIVLCLLGTGGAEEPEPTSARERAAAFAAAEEYDRVMELYGDQVGAVLSAQMTYDEAMAAE